MTTRLALLACVVMALSAPASKAQDRWCTYTDWTWNSVRGEAEDVREVRKPYAEVSGEERHPEWPCTVCREDQTTITLSGAPSFAVCTAVAADVERAVSATQAAGFPLISIVGYRVGRTRGPLDDQGRRTQYSNHAYGLAIDVNAAHNGLYDQCVEFSSTCRLRRGGPWRPDAREAIAPGTPLYEEMRAMGWRWGGELIGRQKDFMHFSPWGD